MSDLQKYLLSLAVQLTPIGLFIIVMYGDVRSLLEYKESSEKVRDEALVVLKENTNNLHETKLAIQALNLSVQDIDEQLTAYIKKDEERHKENQENIIKFYDLNKNLVNPRTAQAPKTTERDFLATFHKPIRVYYPNNRKKPGKGLK